MNVPLIFEPIYQERVWGGRAIEEKFTQRSLPPDRRIGESWEVVDRPEALSRVAAGPAKGRTLRDLMETEGARLMGPNFPSLRPFPILVKWLDCQERLSLQVHPPAAVAPELGGEPKTENWYIAGATPEAALIAGLKRGVSRSDFEKALREESLESLLHRLPARPGDSLFVPSGRLHAIDAGNFILEIQQNSDTTYRVYDWGRTGLDGQPRQLHVEESLRSIDFDDFEPPLFRSDEAVSTLAECPEFRIRRFRLEAGEFLPAFAAEQEPRLLHVVSGRLAEENLESPPFPAGTNAILPYAGAFRFRAEEPAIALVTDRFV